MMFRTLPFLLFWSIILSVASLSCKESATPESQSQPGDQSQEDESLRILDKEAFSRAIRKSNAVVVDVRTPQEFEQGHIENAININFFDPEFKYKLLDLNRNKKYYLYCKNETRSYRSMKFMEDNDFKHVFMLKDGYEGWNTVKAQ